MRRPIEKRDDDRRGKKVSADCSWFVAIEKRAVLTEVRSFGDPHFDKTRCLPIIKRLLYLLNQGETFTKSEAAALLSSVVNLYRFHDVRMRRMFYLIAKELLPFADEVALVTSSLLKDTNSNIVIYRANAIRLLCWMTNGMSSTQIKNFFKEAFLDKNPVVQSAALVCAIHLIKRNPRMASLLNCIIFGDVVHSVRAKHVQFHALYLLFWIYKYNISLLEGLFGCYALSINRSGISKWCSSPLSVCIMALIISQIARAMHISVVYYLGYYIYLKSCINHKDEMVAIEGFRSLEELKDVNINELELAVDVIRRILCASYKPVVRFGAFRALQKVGVAHNVVWATPEDYSAISLDMNINKLYLDELNHRDYIEDAVEQLTKVVKSQSFAITEAPSHNLRRRLV